MKQFLYRIKYGMTILLSLTMFFFISCGEDNNDTDEKTCDITCASWETCVDGTCELAVTDLGLTTGTYPNQMLLNDGALYLVNSGDNAIQKIDLSDLSSNDSFISLPENSNPYFMTINNNELFVTNLMTNSYSRVMLDDETNVTTTAFENESLLKGPEGIAVNDDSVFITNTNSVWDADTSAMVYQDGFITLVNKSDNTFNKIINTTQKNPQRTFILNNKLFVLNSGIIEFDASYIAYPKSNSGIDILDLNDLDAGFSNIEIPFTDGELSGFVGSYSLSDDNKKLYLASGSAPELYSYDIENNTMLRNTDNAIILDTFDTPSSVMLNLASVGQYLFVISFNNDMLYILDTQDDYKLVTKLDIGEDTEAMEGPQGITYDKVNKKVYIFFGISKKLISIDISNL